MKTGEMILLYNLSGTEKGKKIKKVLIPLGITIREIKKEQYLQPIGALAGIKGYEKTEEAYLGEGFLEEMIVMNHFSSQRLDFVLKSFRKAGIERIHLKAIVTPTNVSWNSLELYREIKREHESMNS
ncbi:DUF3783 domain-containing protein [Velocimicrobium porci]|uniref:DUF3783 domain-containing protein n=1 Tax=Velocimicrobium porci TaxID=2606634 RepID=A0A6L5XZI8_9FIRM|nr:DUF3783 domain-containing protein [Velocimicrobium porci]MSS64039.1 DUF3783 domain-containing protein [Velocimicrobium porci]